MRRLLLILLVGGLSGFTACAEAPGFECGGVRAVVTEVEQADSFQWPDGSSDQARPGFQMLQVVMEVAEDQHLGLSWCEIFLTDGQGNRYEPDSRVWRLAGVGQYVWTYEVPETASGFRLLLPDGAQVDLGI